MFVEMDSTVRSKKIYITMIDYLKECIAAFSEAIDSGAKTPAASNLFEVNNDTLRFDKERSEAFHHIVAKLLNVSKRTRLDISLAIAFLCTRVTKSTVEDWGKLKRLLQCIKGTINMPRVIRSLELTSLMTYVNVSYGVHPAMRGYTGGLITMGIGRIHTKSFKQRISTKSSCETEVVGTSYHIP